jgi:CBS domain-containing protein
MAAVVRDVMSAHPISVRKTASFKEIAARLREYQVSAFPVHGIVTLEGTPETISVGHQVLDKVRHVQGVVAVRDRLVYPLPPVPATPGPYL